MATSTRDDFKTSQAVSTRGSPEHTASWMWDRLSVFSFLLGWRLLNALTLRTFFQPDEYYQALEPAWQSSFGDDGRAWITWEWQQQLRSTLHPGLLALAYKAAGRTTIYFGFTDTVRVQMLLAIPKVVGACTATVGDYYTWQLAKRIYEGRSGEGSALAQAALYLTVLSPWQWFVSTRTFSNCLETALTTIALCHWPWAWPHSPAACEKKPLDRPTSRADLWSLRWSLLFAAFATILRPTNIIVWIIMSLSTFVMMYSCASSSVQTESRSRRKAIVLDSLSTMIRESVLCGSIALLCSCVVDRSFYGKWTFPPYNFLHFNVVRGIADFYGSNRLLYYFTEGYALLMTVYLPFFLLAMIRSPSTAATPDSRARLSLLKAICLGVPVVMTFLSHKEVRFIYPILPTLHVLMAQPVHDCFGPLIAALHGTRSNTVSSSWTKVSAVCMLSFALVISLYTGLLHNSGIVQVTDYLRVEFEMKRSTSGFRGGPKGSSPVGPNMTVAFLMPCHSIPWRSHIQYPPSKDSSGIAAWALTCEPPIHLGDQVSKQSYLDEADIFYANPKDWVKRNMERQPPLPSKKASGVFTGRHANGKGKHLWNSVTDGSTKTSQLDITDFLPLLQNDPAQHPLVAGLNKRRLPKRPWPDYLVFFAQLEPVMVQILRETAYVESKRLFNSHWHDDWRRKGDVIVWTLDPDAAADYWAERIARARSDAAEFGVESATASTPSEAQTQTHPQTQTRFVVGERPGTQTVVVRSQR